MIKPIANQKWSTLKEKSCRYCGTIFCSTVTKEVYCSRACAGAYWRQTNPEQYTLLRNRHAALAQNKRRLRKLKVQ